jgi:8-oxo-dGTP pyrophosphatase MutT (NUDIX family)
MLRRNSRSVFAGGAHVFPGGALDDDDRHPELQDRCLGLDELAAARRLEPSPAPRAFWIAAIRETFEEAGVLLARAAATGEPIDMSEPALAEAATRARRALLAGEARFLDVVRELDVLLDAGALEVAGRWITPEGAVRRYDTWFFVAAAPVGHAYAPDDEETVASSWVVPVDALAQAAAGELDLVYPTIRMLQVLGRLGTAADLLDAYHRAWRDLPAPLRVANGHQGWLVQVPGLEVELEADHADAQARGSRRLRRAQGG